MFISERIKRNTLKTAFIYIGITIFVGLFGGIYEMFSNNVFSPAMYLAWIIPCTLGAFVYLALALTPLKKVPGMVPACVYNFGVAMFTIRSIFIGVIEIYGTTNRLMLTIYTILSVSFLTVGGISFIGITAYSIYYTIKTNSHKNNREGV